MKTKRLLAAMLLLSSLGLASCNDSTSTPNGTTPPATTIPDSSPQPTTPVVEPVWILVGGGLGAEGDLAWDVGNKTPSANIKFVEKSGVLTLEVSLYKGDSVKVGLNNGSWDGILGFSDITVGQDMFTDGGGNNIAVGTNAKYTITIVDGKLQIVKGEELPDPVVVKSYKLKGSQWGDWTTLINLVETGKGTKIYTAEIEFKAGTEFGIGVFLNGTGDGGFLNWNNVQGQDDEETAAFGKAATSDNIVCTSEGKYLVKINATGETEVITFELVDDTGTEPVPPVTTPETPSTSEGSSTSTPEVTE